MGGRPRRVRSRPSPGPGRGGSRSRSPRPSPGGAGSRSPPGGRRAGGSEPSRPPKAPDSNRAREPASMPLPETSVRTTSIVRPPFVRAATTKSPENDWPPAGRSAISRCQPWGSCGNLLWTRMRSRRSNSMVPPRRQGTPTRLRNCAISRPKKPQAATTRTTPGVTRPAPSVYGPSFTDSTISAVAAAAYRPSRLAGRRRRPPVTIGRTSAAGEHHTELARVVAAMIGIVMSRPTSAIQSEPSPRK